MPEYPASLDRTFRALGDPTRRAVIERLAGGSATVSELARPFPMALASFSQHLEVLERCGLVRSSKSGRVRTYELDASALQPVNDWLTAQRSMWERRLDQFDRYARQLQEEAGGR